MKQFLLRLVKALMLAAFSLFFFLKWNEGIARMDLWLSYLLFFAMWSCFYGVVWLYGFRFIFLLQGIKKHRINFPALIYYCLFMFFWTKSTDFAKLFKVSVIMGVLQVLFLVLLAVTPLYMEDKYELNQSKEVI